MMMTFKKDRFLARAKREGFLKELTEEDYKLLDLVDGREANDYNWESFVKGNDVCWIEADGNGFEGCYVSRIDCV